MVKSSVAFITIATCLSFANAQTPTLSIPSELASLASVIPTDLSAAASAASMLLKNPGAVQSMLSEASAQGSLIPSQYQSSYYSVLAEASKSANAIQPKNTSASDKSGSAASHPITFAVCTMTIIGALLASFF